MNLSELHYAGGIPWMIPIDILAIINLSLAVYLAWVVFGKKTASDNLLETLKHLGGLTCAWGAFSTLVGLFQAFRSLEQSEQQIPFNIICGGLAVALITVLYGLIVYMLTLVAYIVLRLNQKNASHS